MTTMIYTDTQTTILHWTFIALIAAALIALFLMIRAKIREYQKLVAWRKGLKRHNWVKAKGYENPMMVWVNYGDVVILKDNHYYPALQITDVYPYDIPSWEITHEDEKEGKSIVGCIMLVTLISLVTIFSVIVAILI